MEKRRKKDEEKKFGGKYAELLLCLMAFAFVWILGTMMYSAYGNPLFAGIIIVILIGWLAIKADSSSPRTQMIKEIATRAGVILLAGMAVVLVIATILGVLRLGALIIEGIEYLINLFK